MSLRPTKNQGGRACRADLQQLAIWAGNSPPACVGASVCPSVLPLQQLPSTLGLGSKKGHHRPKKDGIRRHPGQVIALHLLHEEGNFRLLGKYLPRRIPAHRWLRSPCQRRRPWPTQGCCTVGSPADIARRRHSRGQAPHVAMAKAWVGIDCRRAGATPVFIKPDLSSASLLPPLSCHLTLALPLATSPL